MAVTMAKCGRCGRIYRQLRSLVCYECQPAEDADFEKIRDIVSVTPNLNAQQVAEAAGVPAECVLRMLDEGMLASDTVISTVKCGRCGAPAISRTKRLCTRCLRDLDSEVRATVAKIRQQLHAEKKALYPRWRVEPSNAYRVHEALRRKRRNTGTVPQGVR